MSGSQDTTDNPLGGRRKLAPVSRSAFNGSHVEERGEHTHAPSAGGSRHPLRGGRSKLAPVGGSTSALGDTSGAGSKLPPIDDGRTSNQSSPTGSEGSQRGLVARRDQDQTPAKATGRSEASSASSPQPSPPTNNTGEPRPEVTHGESEARSRLVESSPRPGSQREGPPPKLRRYQRAKSQRSKGGTSVQFAGTTSNTGKGTGSGSPRSGTDSPRDPARRRARTTSQSGPGEEYVDETATVGTLASMHKGPPSRPRAEVFYVENLATGEFMKVNRAQLAQVTMKDKTHKQVVSRSTTFKSVMDHTARFIATILMAAQGLLGGFALLQFYMSYPRFSPNDKFLAYYSPISADSQRIYLILTTLSLLGGIDKYAKDRMEGWRNGGWKQQARDFTICFLYLCAFVFSLANAQFDDLLHYANNRVPEWWVTIGISPPFGRQLDQWHAFNIIRCVSSFIAWGIVCYESHTYNFNSSNWDLFKHSQQRSGVVQPGTSGVAGLTGEQDAATNA